MRSLIHSTIQDVSIKEKLGNTKSFKRLWTGLLQGMWIGIILNLWMMLGIDEIALKKGMTNT